VVLNEAVSPVVGEIVSVRSTVPVNPWMELTDIVDEAEAPVLKLTVPGEVEIVKSGA
jgi:hypothetical protein